MIIGIVAVDSKWGIGKNNDLLFNLKSDMEFFKSMTTGNIVCMGYNTFLSLPKQKPLPNRVNVVLCPADVDLENCICFHTFDEMLHFIQIMAKQFDVYIMGGAMFYKSMLPYYDKVAVTKVQADGDAEVFFPNLDTDDRYVCFAESEDTVEGDYTFKFTGYKQIKNIK